MVRITPSRVMLGASLVAFLCFFASAYIMSLGPWFGVDLIPHESGVEVLSVMSDGAAANKLKSGDVVTAVHSIEENAFIPIGGSLVPSVYVLQTFQDYNEFFKQQLQLSEAAVQGPLILRLTDGEEVEVTAREKRPISDFHWSYWLLSGAGVIVFLVGVGVWVFRSDNMATRLIAISAVGYMVGALSLPIYTSREWLLPPQLLWWLYQLSHFGSIVYGFAAMLLFWYFPKPLGRFPMAWFFSFLFILFLLNELLQVTNWSGYVFTVPYLFAFVAGGGFTFLQWRATRHSPLDRAALMWFVRTTMLSTALVIVLYFVPQLFGHEPFIPLWGAEVLMLGLYVGVVLGVLRFHLFELDRWWFVIWVWFFGGLLVILFDFVLVYYAGFQQAGALPISLLAIGWVYFPLRQWLWGMVMSTPKTKMETLLPELLETFFDSSDDRRPQESWLKLLKSVFGSLQTHSVAGQLDDVHILNNGMLLEVPGIGEGAHIVLEGRNGGTRLFNNDDIQFVSFIHKLAQRSAELKDAQEQGASIERERIARDLHDDVAPLLLTLVHRSENQENAQRARVAMQTLRESIYSLSETEGVVLADALADWRVEVSERGEAAGLQLSWKQPMEVPEITLTVRQNLNLKRVMREALTNALRHAEAKYMDLSIEISKEALSVSLSHGGKIWPLNEWRAGKGINNMRTRIGELGGVIHWKIIERDEPRLEVKWSFPFHPKAKGFSDTSDEK